MKKLKYELKRFIVFMLVFSIVSGVPAIPANGEEMNIEVLGDVFLPYSTVQGNEKVYNSDTMEDENIYTYNVIPGIMNVIFSKCNNDFLNSISNVSLVSDSIGVTFDCIYESVSAFNTIIINVNDEMFYYKCCTEMARKSGVTGIPEFPVMPDSADYDTDDDYKTALSEYNEKWSNYEGWYYEVGAKKLMEEKYVDKFSDLKFMLNITYDGNKELSIPVQSLPPENLVTSKMGIGTFGTAMSIVLNLSDSKSIDDEEFKKLEKAIKICDDRKKYSNKYYVDIDSNEDILLPLNAPENTVLTKLKIGPQAFYNVEGVSVLMDDKYALADSGTEEVDLYTFKYSDENGVLKTDVYTEDYPEELAVQLCRKGIFLKDDGSLVNTVEGFYRSYKDGQYVVYDKSLLDKEKLNDIIFNNYMVKNVPNKYLDGTPADDKTTECVFHLEFNETDEGKMNNFYEDLKNGLDRTRESIKVKYELGTLERGKLYENTSIRMESKELIKKLSYSNTKFDYKIKNIDQTDYISQSQNYNGTTKIFPFSDENNKQVKISSIEYTAYDYITFDYIKKHANNNDITFNNDTSFIPDFDSIEKGEKVCDYYQVEKVGGTINDNIYYKGEDIFDGTKRDGNLWEYVDSKTGEYVDLYDRFEQLRADGKSLLARKSETVEKAELSGVGGATETSNAEYENNKLHIPTQSVLGLEKGITYNVTAQIMSNTFYNMNFGSFKYKDRKVSFNGFLYSGGDLVRTYKLENGDKSLYYTEYKWGEMVLASKPDKAKELKYDKDNSTLSWERPDDIGLGIKDDAPQSDDYINITKYTVNVYNHKNKKIWSKETDSNFMDVNQSMQFPEEMFSDGYSYTLEVLCENAIGTSEPARLILEKTDKPAVTIKVTADETEYLKRDTVKYDIVVSNTGNIPLTNLRVTENIDGIFENDNNINVSDNTAVIAKLDEEGSYILHYSVKAEDVWQNGKIVNKVSVVTDEKVSDTDELMVKVLSPDISVTKTTDKQDYKENESIVYKEEIKNTGDTDLTNIVVTEDLKGTFLQDEKLTVKSNSAVISRLEQGETYILTYTVKASEVKNPDSNMIVSNVDVVTDEGAKAQDSKTVRIIHPGISIKIEPEKQFYYFGKQEKIFYNCVVENIGDCTLTGIVVTESLEGSFKDDNNIIIDGKTAVIPDLASGGIYTFMYSVELDDVVEKGENKLTNNISVKSSEGAVDNAYADVDIKYSDSEETTEDNPTESSEESTKENPTESSEESTKENPTESSEESTKENPTESSEESTKENPTESSEESTKENPTESSEESTKENPIESSEESTKENPTESSEESTKENPTESSKETTEENPTESSEIPTESKTTKNQITTKIVDTESSETTSPMSTESGETTSLSPAENETTYWQPPTKELMEETTIEPTPATGDDTYMGVWVLLLLVSMTCAQIVMYNRKNQ